MCIIGEAWRKGWGSSDVEQTFKITKSTSLQTMKTLSCYDSLQEWVSPILTGVWHLSSVAGGGPPG